MLTHRNLLTGCCDGSSDQAASEKPYGGRCPLEGDPCGRRHHTHQSSGCARRPRIRAGGRENRQEGLRSVYNFDHFPVLQDVDYLTALENAVERRTEQWAGQAEQAEPVIAEPVQDTNSVETSTETELDGGSERVRNNSGGAQVTLAAQSQEANTPETPTEKAPAANDAPPLPEAPEDPNCMDITPDCDDWAQDGECQANAEYMQEACPRSCKFCTPVQKVS